MHYRVAIHGSTLKPIDQTDQTLEELSATDRATHPANVPSTTCCLPSTRSTRRCKVRENAIPEVPAA